MKKQGVMRIFLDYIVQHIYILISTILFAGIFCLIFYLYNIEVEVVLYSFGLCSVLTAVMVLINYIKFYNRHKELERIQINPEILSNQMPAAKGIIEKDYQNIVLSLQDVNRILLTDWQNQKNESVDYYTTWVHQIKTPISVLRLILQEEDTPEHQEQQAELFKIEQYVEMVLSYLRLDSTSSDFVFKKYSLDEMIKQCVRKYAGQFVRKRIGLNYTGTDVSVLTDEKWLCFILEQIISNAVKYTEKGSVTITVDDNNILKVNDTGIGIAPEDLPRIFEKGFTGYNGRTDKKSTGLGLYLCKRAAGKLSHRIDVTSHLGCGTTISIDLKTVRLEVE